MKGYTVNIEEAAKANEHFRTVLYTSAYMQLVLMSIPEGGEIPKEVHGQDQFIRVEAGMGTATLAGVAHTLSAGFAIIVPAGTEHTILNSSSTQALKLHTLYSPPHHADGVVHETIAIAEAAHEEFLGDTTE